MMPVQGPPPEQIRAAIEAGKARLTIVSGLVAAYSGLLDQLPPNAVLNGLQVIAGEEVKEIPTDAIRAAVEAHIAAWALEATALQGQIAGLQSMLPGHVVVARPRLA